MQDEAAESLQNSLQRLLELLTAPTDTEEELWEMPVRQIRGLRMIASQNGLSLGEAARKMAVPLPSASRIVEKLVQRGLIARQADPSDRRALRLSVTPEARKILDRLDTARKKQLAACADRLGPEGLKAVLEGLERLADSLAEASSRSEKA